MTASDPLDGRIRQALTELVDRAPVAPGIDELEPSPLRRHRRAGLLVAVAALVVTVPVGVALVGGDDTTVATTPTDDPGRGVSGSVTPCLEEVTSFPDPDTDVVVYLHPDATPEQRQAVLASLRDQQSVRVVRSWEQAELYEEFFRLFFDREQREGVTPEALPPRIELDVAGTTSVDTVISTSEALPSVRVALRLEDAVGDLERMCRRNRDDETVPTPTTTTLPGADVSPSLPEVVLSEPGESAREVVERVMRVVLDDAAETTGVENTTSRTRTVTLESTTGSVVEASVVIDDQGRYVFERLATPGFVIDTSAGVALDVPESGHLTIIEYDAGLQPGETLTDLPDANEGSRLEITFPEDDPGPGSDSSWLRADLVTEDGRVLRYLAPR